MPIETVISKPVKSFYQTEVIGQNEISMEARLEKNPYATIRTGVSGCSSVNKRAVTLNLKEMELVRDFLDTVLNDVKEGKS